MDPMELVHKPKSERKKLEILFDGYFYDITDFANRHPGGNVIRYYTEKGEDATLAILQFHHRSKKRVSAIMSSLQKRKASDDEIGLDAVVLKKNRALTEDFTKLHLQLENEGYFEPSYTHVFLRIFEIFVMEVIGLSLVISDNWFTSVIGLVIAGLAHGRCGWIQHECGHYSFSGCPKVDRFCQALVMGFGFGMSSTWWTRHHNRHHAMPQRINHDADLNTLPLLAFNAKAVKNSTGGKGFMVQNQAYLFVLFDTILVGWLWKLYLHPKLVFERRRYLEIFSMCGHFIYFYYLGFWTVMFSTWIASMYLFVNFSLNHTFLPVATEPTHWIEYSLLHTANVVDSCWCDWWMGYLNYQIEHHLFPTMPRFRHRQIKDRVRALADKHNIPYRVHSYAEAVTLSLKNLANVAKELECAE